MRRRAFPLAAFHFSLFNVMRPAFSSTRQAAAFASLLLALLLAPPLAGKKCLPSREESYASITWSAGDFPYIEQQIFREKGDLDLVFMGASHIWAAFNSPRVQEQLSQQLGRPAAVRTFGWGWPSDDTVYFVARDLMAHRRVRMLVIDDNCGDSDMPHPLASHFFRFGDDMGALDGLPAPVKAIYYFAAVAGMPRTILGLARPSLPADLNARSYWENRANAPNLPGRLGAIAPRLVFTGNPQPFTVYVPKTGARPSDVCVYSPETKTNFVFSDGIPPLQLHFAQKLAALAKEQRSRLLLIHVPLFDERRSDVISMPVFWPEALDADVTMLGMPPARLFQGLTDAQIRRLYSDAVHLNENGQNYFTSLMTPALLKTYESQNP